MVLTAILIGGATGATGSVVMKLLPRMRIIIDKVAWKRLGEDRMKNAFISCVVALTLCVMSSGAGHAQTANPATPTTRILAIGTLPAGVDRAKVLAILPNEVRETVDLYLAGKIDQWYSLQGRTGVAFILNVTDEAAARDMLEKLPLGQAHLMNFELIPLAPLNPLRWLQGMKPVSP
jgi:hypothetical protein